MIRFRVACALRAAHGTGSDAYRPGFPVREPACWKASAGNLRRQRCGSPRAAGIGSTTSPNPGSSRQTNTAFPERSTAPTNLSRSNPSSRMAHLIHASCPGCPRRQHRKTLGRGGVDRIAPAWRLGYAAVNISEGPSLKHQVAFAALAALHRRSSGCSCTFVDNAPKRRRRTVQRVRASPGTTTMEHKRSTDFLREKYV